MTQASKKRKRRSFWEPDSPKLNEWLDAQSDLGTSLQLIIVDAIHRYGSGDVIKAHLNQREKNMSMEETAPVVANSINKEIQQQHSQEVQVPLNDSTAKKPIQDVNSAARPEIEVKFDIEIDEPNTAKREVDINEEEPLFNVSSVINQTVSENSENGVPDYDPIAIMMGDTGSKLNK